MNFTFRVVGYFCLEMTKETYEIGYKKHMKVRIS